MGNFSTPGGQNADILRATINGESYGEPPTSEISELLIELNQLIIAGGGGGGGTTNYNGLTNKPQINGVELKNNKSLADLGIVIPEVDSALSGSSENPVQNKIIKGALDGKQNITDNTLQTTDKTVPGAINEVNTKASHSDYVEYISSTTDTYGYLICGLLKLADLSKLTPHSKIVVGVNANYYTYRGFDREFYQFSSAVTDKSGNMINIYIAGHISPTDWGVFREFHVSNAGVVTVNDISANQIGAQVSIRLYY